METAKGGRAGEPWFNAEHRHELLMSVWLHDIGKLVIPLEVMNKDARLLPEQKSEILHRFEKMRLLIQIASLKGEISVETMQEAARRSCRTGSGTPFFAPIQQAFVRMIFGKRVCRIHEKTYMEEDGSEKPWLEEEEFQMLMIRRGTLSDEERAVMESHVVITDKLLSEIRFLQRTVPCAGMGGQSSRAPERKRLSEASDGRADPDGGAYHHDPGYI